jgi:putative membrane protein
MKLTDLPLLNACLNSLSAVLLLLGYGFIKRQHPEAHRRCMIGALVCSTLFLASYLTYHFFAGRTVFRDPAWFRPYYLGLLLTHTVLAVVIVPMVLLTVWHAIRQRFEAHRRMARWTWPLWMYVSVTGVLIYLLLYRIFPQGV